MPSRSYTFCLICYCILGCNSAPQDVNIYTSDVMHFWNAYDKMQSTTDSLEQLNHLKVEFLNKSSTGQQAMIDARGYTAAQYQEAIKAYPKLWESIRSSTEQVDRHAKEISKGIQKFKKLYPDYSESQTYLTMGVFRSPGTGFDSLLLIGSEFALGHPNVDVSELPQNMNYVSDYYQLKPLDYLEFLAVHEYVHTQQKSMVFNNLSLALYEGVAEFVAEKATGKTSPFENIKYGQANSVEVWKLFERDMFTPWQRKNWLWNSTNNPMGVRDMAYYIGYTFAEKYYERTEDKRAAVKYLIELDYTDEEEIERLVEGTGLLSDSLNNLYTRFQESRPRATGIVEFENGAQNVNPNLKTITIRFSEPMDTGFISTDFGELGREYFPRRKGNEINSDGLSVTYTVELEPNKRYQMVLGNSYRTPDERPLKPYVVDFKTK